MSSPASGGPNVGHGPGSKRAFAGAVRLLLLLVFYALAASSSLADFVAYPGLNRSAADIGGADFFGDMIYGRAPQPYVGRVLLPWLVRGTAAVLPGPARAAIADRVRSLYVRAGEPAWLDRYALEFELTRAWLFLFLLLFAWALHRLSFAAGLDRAQADLVPLAALGALPMLYGYVSHLYDLPGLALFTLGLALIAERRLAAYIVVFTLACVNKETAILLTLVWLLVNWQRLDRRRLLALLAVQVGVWLAVRVGLVLLFRGNPGVLIPFRLGRNLPALATLRSYVMFRPFSSWLVMPSGLNVVTVGLFLFGLAALRRLPPLFGYAYLLAVPVVLLSLLFGNIDEMRVYYELYPAAAVAVMAGLFRLLGYPRPDSEGTLVRRPAG